MTSEKLAQAEETGLHKLFKLQSTISVTSMVSLIHHFIPKEIPVPSREYDLFPYCDLRLMIKLTYFCRQG